MTLTRRLAWLGLMMMPALLLAQVKLPPFQKHELPNGVVLLLSPKKDLPLVSVKINVRGGAGLDPVAHAGLASVTADLLSNGTEKYSQQQFAEKIDFIGARFNSRVTRDRAEVSIEYVSKDANEAFGLLEQALLHPSFPPAEVDKVLNLFRDRAKRQKDNPESAIRDYAPVYFYGPQHPYGRPLRGDEVTLAGVTRDDIVALHRQMIAGRNLVVSVVGDFDAAEMKSRLTTMLGSLPAGERFAGASATPGSKPSLLLVDKPDATQTYFTILQPGVDRKTRDGAALDLVNTLFGGRFTSMLNDSLRVNAGLTYGATSEVDRNRLPGAISINTFTKTETTVAAMDLALEELKKLRTKGITEAQLKSAKAYVKGLYPTQRLETADQVAEVLTDLELFGLNRGEVDDYFSRIDAVTLDSANEVIKRYFRDDNLVFVLIGKASAIRDQVKKYSPELVEVAITKPGIAVR